MFKLNFSRLTVCIFITAITITGCGKQQSEKTDSVANIKPIDIANFDTTVMPGDNFFEYANGGWMKNNPIPDAESRWGSFNILQEETNKNLRQLVEDAAATTDAKKGTPKQQIGDFFTAGMDTATIEKLGYEPIKEQIKNILNVKNFDDLMEQFYYLQSETVTPLFGMWAGPDDKNSKMVIAQLGQGGLGLGNRDYYFEQDERSKNIREKYVEHIGKMLKLVGQENFEQRAKAIMEFETKLAGNSMTIVEQRDPFKTYNKISIPQLKKIVPLVDWDKFFTALNIPVPKEINITSTPFFTALSKNLKSTNIEILKDYFVWNLISERAAYLSSDFVNQNFDFWGKTFQGKQVLDDRWKRVLRVVSGSLGEALGRLYVEKHFPETAKTRMEELIDNIKVTLGERIAQLDWMAKETKAKAQEKLSAIKVKVGYPNKWIDYSKVEIMKDKYCQNVVNSAKFEYARMLSEIDKPYDTEKWHMTPQTVNAYYSPNSNEIVFPAGILQPPFFFKDGDDAVNYGGIGVVIAHEITHGFDDQGRNFDKEGNLAEWWTKEDIEKFNAKTKIYGTQWEAYKYPQVSDDAHINPALTMGENIADLGGVTISITALKKILANKKVEPIDGFTPIKRFFLAYAQVWRQNIRTEELANRLKNDVHSPGDARVNVVITNIDDFYSAFNVTEKNKMYRKPEDRMLIW